MYIDSNEKHSNSNEKPLKCVFLQIVLIVSRRIFSIFKKGQMLNMSGI